MIPEIEPLWSLNLIHKHWINLTGCLTKNINLIVVGIIQLLHAT